MPTSTFIPLATTTLGATASSVTFSSIPATYRDLIVVVAGTTDVTETPLLQFNSDTGSNYSWVRMDGTGSSTNSASGTFTAALFGRIGTVQSVNIAQIMDYSATDKHKTVLGRGDLSNDRTRAMAARWANTAAITSVSLSASGALFQIGTVISLYGIEA